MADLDDSLEIDDSHGISGKVDVNWLLSRAIDRLHAQLLKLPHEVITPGSNEYMGVKYSDIKQSFVDGVNGLTSIIVPLDENEAIKKAETFEDAFDRLKEIVRAMQRNRILFQKEKHEVIDEVEGKPYASQQDPADLEKPDSQDDMGEAPQRK